MAIMQSLREKYESLDRRISAAGEEAIDAACLLAFEYEYPDQPAQVCIDTDEFTALCPWTGLPDYGVLKITYTPSDLCIELKSLKYYLLSYRDVGIVQEHAANRVLKDLVSLCQPRWMRIDLDYKVRGGLHTTVSVEHTAAHSPRPGHAQE
jgi:7-cyano-7-deazaguanine reductase